MGGSETMTPDFPLKVRRVVTQRKSYSDRVCVSWVVGDHPWAGVYFKNERDAVRYFEKYANSFTVSKG